MTSRERWSSAPCWFSSACRSLLALTEAAVSYHVLNRNNGAIVSSGAEAGVPAPCPEELRPHQADAARHQHARRRDVASRARGKRVRWNRVADEQGFIVVYPSGVAGPGPGAGARTAEPVSCRMSDSSRS